MQVNLYRKKVLVEAVQLTEETYKSIRDWSNKKVTLIGGDYVVNTLEGDVVACLGDYVLKGINNEVWPCNQQIFKRT